MIQMKLFSLTQTEDIATITCFTHSSYSNSLFSGTFIAFQIILQFVHKLLQRPCHPLTRYRATVVQFEQKPYKNNVLDGSILKYKKKTLTRTPL